jgi:hypothetical protein
VARDVAQELYARANRLAADAGRAESLYLRWLRAAAAAGRSVAPVVPGRSRRVTTGSAAPAAPGRSSRVVTEAAEGQVERVLGRGSSGAAMAAELAARLGPLVGSGSARVARLHTDDAADHQPTDDELQQYVHDKMQEYFARNPRGDGES